MRISAKKFITASTIAVASICAGEMALSNGEVRESLSKVIPYDEVVLSNPNTKIEMRGPIWKEGSVKGNVGDSKIDFHIDKTILTLFDKRNLSGKHTLKSEEQNVNLDFTQNLNIAKDYTIKGNWGNKNVDINFVRPILKSGDITGSYNSKPVDIKIDKNVMNILRGHYKYKGTINGKPIDIKYRGFLLNGANMEGTFNGKDIAVRYDKNFNLIRDSRDMHAEINLPQDDKDDFIFFQTMLQISDIQNTANSSSSSKSTKSK